MMLFALIVTYSLIVTCSFWPFKSIQIKELCYFEIGVLLVALAVFFREYSPDYNNYLLSYEGCSMEAYLAMEYSFIWIAKWVKTVFNDSTGVFIIYALIGISLKLWAIKKLTDLRFLSVAVFVSFYFMLHEMIQIRTGVVSGLLLLSIPAIYDRNLKLFLGIVMIACLFHYSAILLLGLWFISGKSINRGFWLILLAAVYCLGLLEIGPATFLSHMHLDISNSKITSYYEALQNLQGMQINIFNPLQLLRCSLLFIILWYVELIHEHNKYVYLLVKIYILGLCCLVFFSAVPVIACRFSELFLIVEIILYPLICYTFVNKNIGKLIPVVIGAGFLMIFYMKFYLGYGG